MFSTDYKNQSLRDRVDYKFDCRVNVDYKHQNFENLNEPDFFCCRLETTNCSVSDFSALRAAIFIFEQEIRRNAIKYRQTGAKTFSALRAAIFI